MTNIVTGMVAGFFATAILSMLMLMKKAMGLMPQLDMIAMLARVTDQPRPVDWLLHFLVGTFFYGLLMALFAPLVTGGYWLTGLIVGAIGWLVASLFFMPAAGKGLFGLGIGASALLLSMMMHLLFGVILGAIYGWLIGPA